MDDELQVGHFKIAIAIATALLTAFLGGGIVLWRDFAVLSTNVAELRNAYISDMQEMRALYGTDSATLAAIAEQAHANSIHRIEHDKSADRWIKVIEENDKRGHRNEMLVNKLQTETAARADPNTGAEGRIRDKRLDRVDSRVDRLEVIKGK